MKCKDYFLAVLMAFSGLTAQAATTAGSDSLLTDASTEFRPVQLVAPAALVTIGWWGVGNGWFHSVRNDVREQMADWRGTHYQHMDDQLQYLPVVSQLGLGLCGAKTRHPLRERIAATATAYAAMGIMVNGIKHTVKEKRPDTNSRNSFPSGHTATAFMGAELVRSEYSLGYGIGAYAFATGIAVMRLYNDRHWLNDVIAGAGIGILSGRIGYWMLPAERKWLGWNKKEGTAMTLVPTYDYETRTAGLAFSMSY